MVQIQNNYTGYHEWLVKLAGTDLIYSKKEPLRFGIRFVEAITMQSHPRRSNLDVSRDEKILFFFFLNEKKASSLLVSKWIR